MNQPITESAPPQSTNNIPVKHIWRPIGVYRTFPLPILPLPPVLPRIKWSRPNAKDLKI